MKASDLIRLSLKGIRGMWPVPALAGFAIAAFCLCFAGAVFTAVKEEKGQAYELLLSANGNLNIEDSMIADIQKIPDVRAASSVLQIPVTVKMAEHTAELTLTGLDPAYLDGIYARGGVFPDDSVMPYMVLNEAACKQLAGEEEGRGMWDIDWLNAGYLIVIGGEGPSVSARVCGILKDDDAENVEAAAYISLSVAKELLRRSNQPSGVKTAWVRITNIGCADKVSRQISIPGIDVINSNQQMQSKWDAMMKEMAYLTVIGIFSLLHSFSILALSRENTIQKKGEALEMLLWMGVKQADISRMFVLNSFIVSLLGATTGIATSYALPSFLPMEIKATSSFVLSIPFVVAAASLGLCILTAALSAAAKGYHNS